MTLTKLTGAILAATMLAILAAPAAQAITFAEVAIDTSVFVESAGGPLYYDAPSETLGNFPLGGFVTGESAGLSVSTLSATIDVFALVTAAGTPGADPLMFDDASILDLATGFLLNGDLMDVAFGPTPAGFGPGVSLLFATTGGPLAADFGPFFVASFHEFAGSAAVTGPGDLPATPDPTIDGISTVLTVNPANRVVPLPAALPALLVGLAGIALVALRRTA